MTKEQEEVINKLRKITNRQILYGNKFGITIEGFRELQEDIETVLNLLKQKDAEIEKKDNAVKRIINRLDNDIKRITESKTEKYCDDYRRCRLKAYRTKTREIKKYIKKQYFERKVKNEWI